LDANPEEVYIGMKVKPVLKDKSEREGKITDIVCYKPS